MVKGQTSRNGIGANSSLELLERGGEPVEVGSACFGREVDVPRRGNRSALTYGREGSDDDVLNTVLVENREDGCRVELGVRNQVSHCLSQAGCPPPDFNLQVAPFPLCRCSSGLERRKNLVMTIVRLEVIAQFEAGGCKKALEGREGRLTKVTLVRRDHRR